MKPVIEGIVAEMARPCRIEVGVKVKVKIIRVVSQCSPDVVMIELPNKVCQNYCDENVDGVVKVRGNNDLRLRLRSFRCKLRMVAIGSGLICFSPRSGSSQEKSYPIAEERIKPHKLLGWGTPQEFA